MWLKQFLITLSLEDFRGLDWKCLNVFGNLRCSCHLRKSPHSRDKNLTPTTQKKLASIWQFLCIYKNRWNTQKRKKIIPTTCTMKINLLYVPWFKIKMSELSNWFQSSLICMFLCLTTTVIILEQRKIQIKVVWNHFDLKFIIHKNYNISIHVQILTL